MQALRQLWRSFFDIRPGERLRVLFTGLYLLFVLFAYYILKPLSRALFLTAFDIDKLPWLYVLIAAVGGLLAFFYTKLAVKSSLSKAVFWATVFSVAVLVALWAALRSPPAWLFYVFNIWVSLFSIILVSQGWLIAANVFNSREAKRVYGILGLASVIGAAFGGSFTAFATKLIGVNNLLLASAFMVVLAYLSYVGLSRLPSLHLDRAKAAGEEEAEFHFSEIITAVGRYRHLQVIVGIIVLTYIVDVMVEYQFSDMAKQQYASKEQLTAFLGSFYGLWLNLITFTLQFFLTAAVVSAFGVGGTLQIMPITIGLASIATFAMPGVLSTGAARLSEAATRYTFNRTGMELLYLPLPSELKNRTKAFVDIFVDRFARGLGGMLLVVFTGVLNMETRMVSLLVMVFCVAWILLSIRARNEYVSTVRSRLESRRLDLESIRVSVNDRTTIQMLETTARGKHPRQAVYALSLLQETNGVDLTPLLGELVDSTSPGVRGKVFEIARNTKQSQFLEQALREIRSARAGDTSESIGPAVSYALDFSPEKESLAKRLLEHPNEQVRDSLFAFLQEHRELALKLLSQEWMASAVSSKDPGMRRMASQAIACTASTNGDAGGRPVEFLIKLLRDTDPSVAIAAFAAAGTVQDRLFVVPMVERLGNSQLRGAIVEALRSFGPRIVGTLTDLLNDQNTNPAVRRHIARVLQNIPHQRSVDALIGAIAEPDLSVRSAVLKALHRLREGDAKLNYGSDSVTKQIMQEARMYYELSAALAPFRENNTDLHTPAGLLAKTLDERLRRTIERLFYLLGLRYPPREVYAAYLAVNRGKAEELSTAVEFLDNVLERELKRILLPLFDAPEHLAERGREVFGLQRLTAETALKTLLVSGDMWLVCCAIAVAAQLRLKSLAEDVGGLREGSGTEVSRVASDYYKQLQA